MQLVLSPQPCIYRARALAALDRVRRPWNIIYTSPSLAGTIAAVRAGLGMTVLPSTMIPEGLASLRGMHRLPTLMHSEIALMKKDNLSEAARMFAQHIALSLENLSYHEN